MSKLTASTVVGTCPAEYRYFRGQRRSKFIRRQQRFTRWNAVLVRANR